MLTKPRPVDALAGQQDIWRLRQPLNTSAVVFESSSSFSAIALGPDSDFSRVHATYMDPHLPERVQEATISVGSPFIGRLSAFEDQRYAVSDAAGRLLLWTDQRFRLRKFEDPNSWVRYWNIPPVFDVIGYMRGSPGAVAAARSDRRIQGNFPLSAPWGSPPPGSNRITIPFYGRRFFSIDFQPVDTQDLSGPFTLDIFGHTFASGESEPGETGVGLDSIVSLKNDESVSLTERMRFSISASDVGFFDYIEVRLETNEEDDVFDGTGKEQLGVTIITSDEEA